MLCPTVPMIGIGHYRNLTKLVETEIYRKLGSSINLSVQYMNEPSKRGKLLLLPIPKQAVRLISHNNVKVLTTLEFFALADENA